VKPLVVRKLLNLILVSVLALPAAAEDCGYQKSERALRSLSAAQATLAELGLRGQDLQSTLNQLEPAGSETVDLPVIVKSREMTETELKRFLEHPAFEQPNTGAVLFMFRAPPTFRTTGRGQKACDLSVTASNNMLHRRTLQRTDGKSREHKVDATGQTAFFNCENGDEVSSLKLSLGLAEVIGGPGHSVLYQATSDRFIENFHKKVLKVDDPYWRDQLGHDLVLVDLRDTEGRQMSMEDGKAYVLPAAINYSRFVNLSESEQSKTTLETGVQGRVPLDKKFNQLGAGAFANAVHTRQLSDRWLGTVAAGVEINIDKTLSGYRPTDGNDRYVTRNLATGLTRKDAGESKNQTSVMVVYSDQTGLLKGSNYLDDRTDFLGRQSRAAATDRERQIAFAVVREQNGWQISGGVAEDVNPRLPGRMNGNNNEDFKAFVRVKRLLMP